MLAGIRRRLTFANVASLVAICLALGAGSYALGAIPGKGGTIVGCYKKSGGRLRVIDTAKDQKCGQERERRLAWNQKGVKGARGPRGPGAVKLDYQRSSSDPAVFEPVAKVGPLSISARCLKDVVTGTYTRLEVRLTSSQSGYANVSYSKLERPPAKITTFGSGLAQGDSFTFLDINALHDEINHDEYTGLAVGNLVYRDASRVISATLHGFTAANDLDVPGNFCQFDGTAVQAG